MKRIVARYTKDGVFVDGRRVPEGFSPIELLVAALAYGVGAKSFDAGAEMYEIECFVDGDDILCRGTCTGAERRCLVFKILSKALRYECT